jgi:putative addiction module CopG family antidote
MTVLLPPDLQHFVHQAVSSGRYRSEEQLMTDAVRMLQERERFRTQLQERVAGMDRGDFLEVDAGELGTFFNNLVAEVDNELPSPPTGR